MAKKPVPPPKSFKTPAGGRDGNSAVDAGKQRPMPKKGRG